MSETELNPNDWQPLFFVQFKCDCLSKYRPVHKALSRSCYRCDLDRQLLQKVTVYWNTRLRKFREQDEKLIQEAFGKDAHPVVYFNLYLQAY